ncbi:WAP four-disulfide core domain protein 1 [Aplysia californica]|uniref:WAP four-disulfide core domain protein 1 n=1 Tax=Aplysia californica TaxID=6500 RepID=A0ABM0KB98_APLCA|nr:WAP four-disulfide core domain protein 1 [Aplysia californica]
MRFDPEQGQCSVVVVVRATVWAWCVASVTVIAAPPRAVLAVTGEQSKERWLADDSFYDVYSVEEQPQADDNGGGARDLCPPVPKVLPVGGCKVPECSSDRQCLGQRLKCCYNGCVYTCLPEVNPAPHFDWFREPRRRFQSGQSWLIPGADDLVDVEMCSTTPPDDDSDPLLCPHGYECSIVDEGNPRRGVPDRGVCVKVSSQEPAVGGWPRESSLGDQEPGAATEIQDSESRHACDLGEGQILLSGHETIIEGQDCLCYETKLVCES